MDQSDNPLPRIHRPAEQQIGHRYMTIRFSVESLRDLLESCVFCLRHLLEVKLPAYELLFRLSGNCSVSNYQIYKSKFNNKISAVMRD